MKILISGGGGYLGTELTQFLLKQNYHVKVIDNFYFDYLLKNKSKIKNNKNLILKKKDITKIVKKDFEGYDVVIDLNGISNDPVGELRPKYTRQVNFTGRLRTAKFAKDSGIKRYILHSTCAVYGKNKNFINEATKTNPQSIYAKANLMADLEIFKLKSKIFKINILRCATIYGFSNTMRLDLVINKFVYEITKGRKIQVDGDGQQYRPFISINEICLIYHSIIRQNNSLSSFRANIVGFNSTIKNILLKIKKTLKIKAEYSFSKSNIDKRNYKITNNLKKFKIKIKKSNFDKEIKILKNKFSSNKIKYDKKTVRILFYKTKFKR